VEVTRKVDAVRILSCTNGESRQTTAVNLEVVNRPVHRNTEPYFDSLQPYVIIQNRVSKVRLT
jgi:hypothetical protein